jgi:hypothetical protein
MDDAYQEAVRQLRELKELGDSAVAIAERLLKQNKELIAKLEEAASTIGKYRARYGDLE